jgi:hypothetical protein
MIEWYDFFAYALIVPLVCDTFFFPKGDPARKHDRGLRYLCHHCFVARPFGVLAEERSKLVL